MGKFFAWLFAASTVYMFSMSSVAIFIFGVTILGFVGAYIGNDPGLTLLYIILAMIASYVLPILTAIVVRQARWLLIIPIVTSVIFAFSSSFVSNTACERGNETGIWAMRAIPLLLVMETFVAPEDEKLSCSYFFGT